MNDILGQVKTVLWGFMGVGGRRKDARPPASPLITIAVAFVLVAILLGGLFVLARYAAGV